MQLELTKEFIKELKGAIERADETFILEKITDLHAADIAEVVNKLSFDEAKLLFTLFDVKKAADVLMELEEEVRQEYLSYISSEEIANQFIENLESDDAADILHELPDDRKADVIHRIRDADQASDIVDLLHYEEGTAGALMAKELIKVNQNWTVEKCVQEIRNQGQQMGAVFIVYVVNDSNHLQGIIDIKELLLTPAKAKVADFYKGDIISVNTSTDSEDVANIMKKYDLVVLPVVDELNRLVGRITFDDVMDVIKEEADKDYQMASGISENIESRDKVWVITRARLPWLLIGLIGGIFGARVIGLYEEDIKIYPEMAFFIPLIAAMGGNVGVQSSAIIVQGLANKSLNEDILANLGKELKVAMINGLICSVLILGYTIAFSSSIMISLTVSTALLSVMIFAGIFGTFIPLVLHRYKIDPAVATGPFITTINDVLGLFIYFLIGRVMYSYFM